MSVPGQAGRPNVHLPAPTDDIVRPTAEAETKMALRRYEFERYINRLEKVPSPPVASMFTAASCFFGGGIGLSVAAYVTERSTTTVEPGTAGVLWAWTAACVVITVACVVCGFLLRQAREDQLADITQEMQFTLESYPWARNDQEANA